MQKHSTLRPALLLLLTCCINSGVVPPACYADNSPLMFVGDFEKRGIKPFDDTQIAHTLNKIEIVTSPIRSGQHALKMTLDRIEHKDMMGYRTDLWIKGFSNKFMMQEEYWYGFSTYWPEAWEPDTQPELFVQWVGQQTYGPSLAIYIYEGDYCIKKRWDTGQAYKNLWRGKVAADKGKWIDWVFHVKWSADRDGVVEVWKNGEKIIADAGRNCGTGELAPYFKFGIYKWPWKDSPEQTTSTVTHRTLYIDEIKIGDKSAGYNLVSPP